MHISCGPLQGITDDIFRSVHHQVFGGVDTYYGPYVRLENHKEPVYSQLRDAESPLNRNIGYIPQILSSQAHLILKEADRLKKWGHQTVNWNLGCPYPMVSKRNMGSGLLNQPQLIKEILEEIMPNLPLDFSIKCRLGLESEEEILPLLEIFNQHPIKEVIIHARTAKQMYKGKANPEKFKALIPLSEHPLVYNGDLNTVDETKRVLDLFEGKIDKLMLGRGLIMRPYLSSLIKGELSLNLSNQLIDFHEKLIASYLNKYQEHQLVPKMRGIWEYFSHSFSNPHKVFKLIKKSKSWSSYQKNTNIIFNQYCYDD